ncbi:MAG: SpoIID/LytB domain-containing protein, partial [Dehalococcoidia bacterium]|nr:SpoIID/LytB domain-containing protein [Dehalococcoidia bacterium]
MRLRVLLLLGVLVPAAWAQPPNAELIRVAVSRDQPEVELEVDGRFLMSGLSSRSPLDQGRRLKPLAVRAVPQGLALGDRMLPLLGVRIEPGQGATVRLNGSSFHGTLEIHRQKDQTLLVINHVPLEAYLRGVLSKEAPDYWPAEALKAIAIAARTYAVYQRFSKAAQAFDVTGDVMSQDYGGKSAEKAATTRAVEGTAGWILLYHDTVFPTFYHSTCGGRTEHARVMGKGYTIEPLQGGIRCSFCTASPFHDWRRRVTRADINWALKKSRHGTVGPVQALRIARRSPSGRVEQISITGTQRTLLLSAYEFRQLLGFERIRSPLFSVVPEGNDFVIDGHGWGHGVGMCQWGA